MPELPAKLTEARLMRDWPTEGDVGGTCALEVEALRETITGSASGSGSEPFAWLCGDVSNFSYKDLQPLTRSSESLDWPSGAIGFAGAGPERT